MTLAGIIHNAILTMRETMVSNADEIDAVIENHWKMATDQLPDATTHKDARLHFVAMVSGAMMMEMHDKQHASVYGIAERAMCAWLDWRIRGI